MADHVDETFQNEAVELDGNTYTDCTFVGCRLIYRGGEMPTIEGCRLDGCAWEFEDSAGRTLEFMRGIYHGMGPGGRKVIQDTFRQKRPTG